MTKSSHLLTGRATRAFVLLVKILLLLLMVQVIIWLGGGLISIGKLVVEVARMRQGVREIVELKNEAENGLVKIEVI